MATRTKAPEATETETETSTGETAEVDKSTVMGWIKEAIAEVLGNPKVEPEVETSTTEEDEEIESPRKQESRMRRTVEQAVGELHIHVGDEKKSEPAKAEPEAVPGKPPFLQRFIGLN